MGHESRIMRRNILLGWLLLVPWPGVAMGTDIPLSGQDELSVTRIRLEGNTVLDAEEIRQITAPYEDRIISARELQTLRRELTELYIARGYVNSGVIIPDQAIDDGVVRLRAMEGVLSAISVAGEPWLRKAYLIGRLSRHLSHGAEVLNVTELQTRLLLLRQDPLIEEVDAELVPTAERGQAELKLSIRETNPVDAGIDINNHLSPNVGGLQREVYLRHGNLTGWGDRVELSYAKAAGMNHLQADYRLPVGFSGTTIGVQYDRSDTRVVAEPFDLLDIKGSSDSITLDVEYPVYKVPAEEFTLGLSWKRRRNRNFLLGEAFSFSAGEREGQSRQEQWHFTQEWTRRGSERVLAAYSGFELGRDGLGGGQEPDGNFFAWRGQFQWLQRIGPLDSQLLFRGAARLTDDTLPAPEKFAIGGVDTVRGYPENVITRDNGLTTSLEWRVPVVTQPLSDILKGAGPIYLNPFIDYGRGWNVEGTGTPEPLDIYSIGLGFDWKPAGFLHLKADWAKGLRAIDRGMEYDLQDSGIHLQLMLDLM
uniref:Hemolysin activation/secretion protein n=1 Tax=Candidatus Kentrum sp. DK TaxID=2126562 RepID=A0A450RVL4_9GAMM|nr:MAG: Hemolysin activation/secretion protein [Candidatus Kentron sp. DK]